MISGANRCARGGSRSLPFPDRDLLFEKDEFTRLSGIKHFITSRGCPYDCTYCFNHALAEIYRGKGKRLRQMSVGGCRGSQSVQARHPLQFVVFLDDLFIVYVDWLRELADHSPGRWACPFSATCGPTSSRRKRSRCSSRRGVSVWAWVWKQATRPCATRSSSGICRRADHRGQPPGPRGRHPVAHDKHARPAWRYPGDDLETLALNHACKPAYANAFLYQPYPRTELGEYARERGMSRARWTTLTLLPGSGRCSASQAGRNARSRTSTSSLP